MIRVNREELKEKIVYMRDQQGLTFSQIANELGVDITRQGVYAIYKSVKESQLSKDDNPLARLDATNYYLLGLSEKEIKEIIKRDYQINISGEQIRVINKNYKAIDRAILFTISACVDKNSSIEEIKEKIRYKGESIRLHSLYGYLYRYIDERLNSLAIPYLENVMKLTNDKNLVNRMMKQHGLVIKQFK